ncbi:DNA gyrase/topoisomerase IV subunit A, partial [Pseudoxanthomonas sp. SGD-10]
AEVVNITLKPMSKLRKLSFDVDFSEIAIKGRGSQGNIVSKFAIKKVSLKSKGVSTLAGRKIWYDDVVKRLNENGHGKFLGEFQAEDKILCVFIDGSYELSSFDLTNHFDDKMVRIEKFNPEKIFSAIHIDGKSKNYYIKRFKFEDLSIGKRNSFINEEPGSKMLILTGSTNPIVKLEVLKGKTQIFEESEVNLSELIDVKGIKAQGNRLSPHDIQNVVLLTEEKEDEEVAENNDGDLLEEDVNEADDPEISEKPKFVSEAKPSQKVEFEITNPDDIDIDDKGQLGLF